MKKLLWYDLRLGFRSNFCKYIGSIGIFCFLSASFCYLLENSEIAGEAFYPLDVLLYVLKGMEVYVPSPDNPFQIDIIWITIQTSIAFLIVHYPTRDFCDQNLQVVLRVKSRIKWWLSKCVWTIVTVLSFYLLLIFCGFITGLMKGNLGLEFSERVSREISRIYLSESAADKLWLQGVIFPIMNSVTVSLMQLYLSFRFTPVIGFVSVICFWGASAYQYSPILFGSYSMILRSDLLYAEGYPAWGIWVTDFVVSIVSIWAGGRLIRKMDFLEKGNRG